MGLTALALATLPVQAADKPAAAEGKAMSDAAEAGATNPNRAIPFRGKLASKTDTSITVGSRTFEITAETKLMKDGKPATLADAAVGDQVGGSYLQKDDKMVAKMVRFGPKPEAAGSDNKPAKDESGE